MGRLFIESFERGFASMFSRYGLPLETMQARDVHGWLYVKPKVAGAPDKGGAPPPDFVLKLITRLHPEMRKRNKAAKQALANKLWLRDAAEWVAERQSWLDRCDALLGIEPSELDEPALGKHVGEAFQLGVQMMRRHFELIGPVAAVGRLVVAAQRHGIESSAVTHVLRGASPASAATLGPLREIAALVLASSRSPATIGELRGISSDVAERVDDYLRRFGWQMLEDDLTAPTLAEQPDRLVAIVGAAGSEGVSGDGADPVAELRQRVPADERERFGELVDEARIAYATLDDNSGVTALAGGMVRRAVLAVASRALGDGRLETEADVWNLEYDELRALADGEAGPGLEELRTRADQLRAASESQPPDVLGDAPSALPDPSLFPAAMGEITESIMTYIGLKSTRREPLDDQPASGSLTIGSDRVAVGDAIGSGETSARVVVCTEVGDALARLGVGDILVCPYTSPGWNSIFPLLGGIVTASGGQLGHTAVMAREFGLPAIVGVGEIHDAWNGQTGTMSLS